MRMDRQTNSATIDAVEIHRTATDSAELGTAGNVGTIDTDQVPAISASIMLGCALSSLLIFGSAVSAATPQISIAKYSPNQIAVGATSAGQAFAVEGELSPVNVEPASIPNTKLKKAAERVNDFNWMASNDPDKLLAMIKEGQLRPSKLTFAAEAAGLIENSGPVREALVPLLQHESPVVREGAIYGLSNHLNNNVLTILMFIAQEDSSPAVRQAAADLLDE
jgi:hypothetical protein